MKKWEFAFDEKLFSHLWFSDTYIFILTHSLWLHDTSSYTTSSSLFFHGKNIVIIKTYKRIHLEKVVKHKSSINNINKVNMQQKNWATYKKVFHAYNYPKIVKLDDAGFNSSYARIQKYIEVIVLLIPHEMFWNEKFAYFVNYVQPLSIFERFTLGTCKNTFRICTIYSLPYIICPKLWLYP